MGEITLQSRLNEVYANPVGHDVIKKILLQLNKDESLITNPITGNLKLSTALNLAKKQLGEGFADTFLRLLNNDESDLVRVKADSIIEAKGIIRDEKTESDIWWKEAVFYQIYPVSFMDSDGDGKGDIGGILSKLDYLKELGVDAIWLSPIYDSPYDDNGYDIRDYYKILKEFGSMEEFDELLFQTHARGMKLIMDLVVNHTSDEHKWFQEALLDPDSKYRDYYFFRQPKEGGQPNNWTSFFGGSAWKYYPESEEYVLHLFSEKQMDLNWDNPEVRKDIYSMVRWWMEKGVDGFRMDVINYISKEENLPDGNVKIGELMGYTGIENYFYGPRLHTYLKELKKEAFEPYHGFSVGETPGVGMQMSRLLTAQSRKELDMVFCFDHLETPGHVRFDDYKYDLNYLKTFFMDWQKNYGEDCWMSLFLENHDNPRFISKVNPDKKFRQVIAKLLGGMLLTLKGTPFLFQGQEIGSINHDFKDISQLRDVESIHMYQDASKELGEKEGFDKILAGTRDHARTPMQWNDSDYGGFSNITPWIAGGEDYRICNVEEQTANPDSVLAFYKKMISLRKNHKTLIYGDTNFKHEKVKNYFAYYREDKVNSFYIEMNLSAQSFDRIETIPAEWKLLSNYKMNSVELRPYEFNLYLCKTKS